MRERGAAARAAGDDRSPTRLSRGRLGVGLATSAAAWDHRARPGGPDASIPTPSDVQQDVDLLIRDGLVVTLDDDERVLTPGTLAIDDGVIVAIGRCEEMAARFRPRERIDAHGQVVMPGLVNTHTHGADALFRGLVDDLALEPWLQRLWRVEQAFVTDASVEIGSTLAYVELIRGGVTTALDMFFYPRRRRVPPDSWDFAWSPVRCSSTPTRSTACHPGSASIRPVR